MQNARRKSLWLAVALVLAVPLLCSCGRGDSSANRLFGETYQLVRKANRTGDAAERAALLSQALAKLSEIENGYPESEAARRFSSGQAIGEISIKGLEALKVAARPAEIPSQAPGASVEAGREPPRKKAEPTDVFGAYLNLLPSEALQGLSNEEERDFYSYRKLGHLRAFAIAGGRSFPRAWGWSYGTGTIDQAIQNALNYCEKSRVQYPATEAPCNLFAIGDIVVYGSLEIEQSTARDAYMANSNATDADWAANWTRSMAPETVSCANAPTLRCVIDLIARTGSLSQRINAAIDVAVALQQSGRESVAGDWLQDAIASVLAMPASDLRDQQLSKIVAAQVEANDITAALRTIKQISSSNWRNTAWQALALGFARAGVLTEAKTTLESIEDPDRRDLALIAIADLLARQPQLDSAYEFANATHSTKRRAEAFAKIAVAQSESSDIAGALKTAGEIGDSDWKASALIGIVAAQAKSGDIAGAGRTADGIPGQPWQAIVPIAEALAAAGDESAALATAESITDIAGRAQAMVAVVRALAKRGNMAAARTDAQRPSLGNCGADALLAVVEAMADKHDFAGALSLTKVLVHTRVYADAVISVAAAQAATGNRYAAVETIDEYMRQMDPTWVGYSASVATERAVAALAKALVRCGLTSQAIATAQSITDQGLRTGVYREIAMSIAGQKG